MDHYVHKLSFRQENEIYQLIRDLILSKVLYLIYSNDKKKTPLRLMEFFLLLFYYAKKQQFDAQPPTLPCSV